MRKIQTALRVSVSLVLVSFISVRILNAVLRDSLPPPLRAWATQEPTHPTAVDHAMGVIGMTIFVSWLAALVGLFRLRRWARWVFLVSVLSGYAFMPFNGPTVAHGLASAADGIFAVLSGVTLSLAFFTEALPTRLRAAPNGSANESRPIP